MRRLTILFLATTLLAAACSGDDDGSVEASATTSDTVDTAGSDTSENEGTPAATTTAPSTTAAPQLPPDPIPSAACTDPPEGPAIENGARVDFASGGTDRYYFLAVPDSTEPVPLVLDLHGYTEGAGIHAAHTNLGGLGATEGFAVATPHGDGTPAQWGFDPSTADVGFFEDLLDHVEATVCVDRARVYATGLSNGAFMSSLLGCLLPERIAAVAPVAGVQTHDDCPIENPTPLLAFHGTDDSFVSFEGGLGESVAQLPNPDGSGGSLEDVIDEADSSVAEELAEVEAMTVPETVADWAEQNGCEPEPVESPVGTEVRHIDYDCPAGGDTQLYIIDGGGHTWPGSEFLADATDLVGHTTFDIDANTLIWEFFREQWLEEPPG